MSYIGIAFGAAHERSEVGKAIEEIGGVARAVERRVSRSSGSKRVRRA